MKKKQPKLDPDVFVRAAELIKARSENYACFAIDRATHDGFWSGDDSRIPEANFFRAVLKPRKMAECTTLQDETYTAYSSGTMSWADQVIKWHSSQFYGDELQGRSARIYGLLLCAVLAEQGYTAKDFR